MTKILLTIRSDEQQVSFCNGVGSSDDRRLCWDSLLDPFLVSPWTQEPYRSPLNVPTNRGYSLVKKGLGGQLLTPTLRTYRSKGGRRIRETRCWSLRLPKNRDADAEEIGVGSGGPTVETDDWTVVYRYVTDLKFFGTGTDHGTV